MNYRCNYLPCEYTVVNNEIKKTFKVKSWKEYQTSEYPITEKDLEVGFAAVVMGETSDDLCGLDFDAHGDGQICVYNDFIERINNPELVAKFAIEKTTRNGYHVYFRSKLGNNGKKSIPARFENGDACIEFFAGNKCVLFCAVTSTPNLYSRVQKDVQSADYITDEEYYMIQAVAKSLNREKKEEAAPLAIVKTKTCTTLLPEYSTSQVEAMRSADGRRWAIEVLERNQWTYIKDTTASDGQTASLFSHPNASCSSKPSISILEDGFYLFSNDKQKNCGLDEDDHSFYQLVLKVEYNGDTKEFSRAFYSRFPQYNNRFGNTEFVDWDLHFDDEEPEENAVANPFEEKDRLLNDIKNNPDYAVLSSHIDCSIRHSAVKMPFGYLLTGISLIGACAYRGFYDKAVEDRADNEEKPHSETALAINLAAPSGSGKNNVLMSLKCYKDKIMTFGSSRRVATTDKNGEQKYKMFETRIEQLSGTHRDLQRKLACGSKNLLLYCDEFQDNLRTKCSNDSNKIQLHTLIKQLVNKTDRVYDFDGSITFNREIADVEKEFGAIDYNWYRVSQFNCGTNQMYANITQDDEEGGFCRRYLWFTERKGARQLLNPNIQDNSMTTDDSFLNLLEDLISIRDSKDENVRLNHPVIKITWSDKAIELLNVYANENEEYKETNKRGMCAMRHSFEDFIYKLAKIFAISRGDWRNYDGNYVETIGDDVVIGGIDNVSVGKKEIEINEKDVEFAWRLFQISCFDLYDGIANSDTVDSVERNDRLFEEKIVRFVNHKNNVSYKKMLEEFKTHSAEKLNKTLKILCDNKRIYRVENNKGIGYWSVSRWEKEQAKIAEAQKA